jgi:hypothetical protein
VNIFLQLNIEIITLEKILDTDCGCGMVTITVNFHGLHGGEIQIALGIGTLVNLSSHFSTSCESAENFERKD